MGDIIFFFQLDLLDSGDPSIGGIPDLFMFTLAPPSIGILYLNLATTKNRWILTSLFVGFSVVFEYLLVQAGFLIQKGWQVWYSIPFYFLFFHVFLPWLLHFIRGEGAPFKEKEQNRLASFQTNTETDRQNSFLIRVTKWAGNEEKTPFFLKWKEKKGKAR